jgi:hypothetical protein
MALQLAINNLHCDDAVSASGILIDSFPMTDDIAGLAVAADQQQKDDQSLHGFVLRGLDFTGF